MSKFSKNLVVRKHCSHFFSENWQVNSGQINNFDVSITFSFFLLIFMKYGHFLFGKHELIFFQVLIAGDCFVFQFFMWDERNSVETFRPFAM